MKILESLNIFLKRPVYSVFNSSETLSYLEPNIWDLVPNEIKQSDSHECFNWKSRKRFPRVIFIGYVKDIYIYIYIYIYVPIGYVIYIYIYNIV